MFDHDTRHVMGLVFIGFAVLVLVIELGFIAVE